jgi:hypothetical protein
VRVSFDWISRHVPPALAVCAAIACAGLGVGCASGTAHRAIDTSWEYQMRAGAEAAREGRPEEALAFYRQALSLVSEGGHQPVRMAHSAWYVGDVCFEHPDLCEPGEARQQVSRSFALFAALYGPEHPVVIPILLRLSAIDAREGDERGARQLLERADRITARTFPESHFMRSASGSHRPASDLDPMELLRILADVDILGG